MFLVTALQLMTLQDQTIVRHLLLNDQMFIERTIAGNKFLQDQQFWMPILAKF